MRINNKIDMESKGCDSELLKTLYLVENKSVLQLCEIFDIKSPSVIERWLKESEIPKRKSPSSNRYSFNKNYFDTIDTEEKAYWLGFIWCDGYVCKRVRNGRLAEYQIKISISEKDIDHLHKLKDSLNSNHPINLYKCGEKAYKTNYKEARLMLSNMYTGDLLYNKYGLIPRRSDVSDLIKYITPKLEKHFIRGVYDAEGSASFYFHQIKEEWKPSLKMNFSIYTYSELIDYIQEHFIKAGLKESKVKTHRRHENADAHCVGLRLSGATQVPKILDYLYSDANIYLKRKHKQYLKIKELVNKKEFLN